MKGRDEDMGSPLEREFHEAMVSICERATRECGYNPRDLRRMIFDHGGLGAARLLLRTDRVSDGFVRLWELKRLDLTVEAHVLLPRFAALFTEEEHRIARRRLQDYGYPVPEPRPAATRPSTQAGEEAVPPAAEAVATSQMATGGSRHHLQRLVGDNPELLNCLLLSASESLRAFAGGHPHWVWPLATNGYRENRDVTYLDALGLADLTPRLAEFWPSDGPVWDGLAQVSGRHGIRGVLLLEARSHVQEITGPGYQVGRESLERMQQRLEQVKAVLGADPAADWVGKYYQAASRIAHLYFLNILAQVPAWLVNLHFVGDREQSGPQTVAEWEVSFKSLDTALGLPPGHLLAGRIITAFLPVVV
ncbi:conserved domain protein [Symbiobacterium thermophilum IAM 14863]|uniref:Conserved domain protein n=3 Tax=Symbiobacterium thermophilum TaxID=2734 RepID=Q67PU9_SYMTH|nr:conserved domain protein [Symbiobacterium thermophilum IAM 14863]